MYYTWLYVRVVNTPTLQIGNLAWRTLWMRAYPYCHYRVREKTLHTICCGCGVTPTFFRGVIDFFFFFYTVHHWIGYTHAILKLLWKKCMWWYTHNVQAGDGLFLKDQDFGRLMVSSYLLIGGCGVWFLMRTPYCTLDLWRFGLRKIGMLLCSFWLLYLSFATSCLSVSNLQPTFLTNKCQLSWSEASRCHDWWLNSADESCLFSWSLKRFLGAPRSLQRSNERLSDIGQNPGEVLVQVTCILLYGSETWTLLADSEKRIQGFRTKCLRKLLRIFFWDRKTNDWGAVQDQLSCGPTGTSSGSCQEREISVVRPCHEPWQPLQNCPSGNLGRRTTPWSAEEMLDGQGQEWVTSLPMPELHKKKNGHPQERQEEGLRWIVSHVPSTTQKVKELNWTDLRLQHLVKQSTTKWNNNIHASFSYNWSERKKSLKKSWI